MDSVIAEREWPVMETLWEKGSATASQIVDAVTSRQDISMRTVKTHIRRLIAKGYVGYSIDPDDSRIYHYRPMVSKADAIKHRGRKLLAPAALDPVTLLDTLVPDASLSDDEVRAIQDLLAKKRKAR